MSEPLFIVLCVLQLVIVSECSGWSSPTSTLIRADNSIIVGAYNDSIFLLGGENNGKQMTEYRIDKDTFIDIGQNVLPIAINAYAQSWSQIDDIIYMIELTGSSLSTFNMITQQYTSEWVNLEINVGTLGCLSASSDHLFITGGDPDLDTLQVLHLETHQWLSNTPPMQQRRETHACIAYNNYLWVFGGWDGRNEIRLKSNERVDVVDIASNQWSYIDPLTEDAYGLRVAPWQQSIFIIGGYNRIPFLGTYLDEYLDTVHIADATTGQVTLSTERLVYFISFHGIISTHSVLYLFGGWRKGESLNTWMKYELSSDISTTSTTSTTSATSAFTSNVPISATTMATSSDAQMISTTMSTFAIINSNDTNESNGSTTTISTTSYTSKTSTTATLSNVGTSTSIERTILITSNTVEEWNEGRVQDDTEVMNTDNNESKDAGSKRDTVYIIIGTALGAILCCALCLCVGIRVNKTRAKQIQFNMKRSVDEDQKRKRKPQKQQRANDAIQLSMANNSNISEVQSNVVDSFNDNKEGAGVLQETTKGAKLRIRVMNRTPNGPDHVIVDNDKEEESSSFTVNDVEKDTNYGEDLEEVQSQSKPSANAVLSLNIIEDMNTKDEGFMEYEINDGGEGEDIIEDKTPGHPGDANDNEYDGTTAYM